jgi:hypothetical protein
MYSICQAVPAGTASGVNRITAVETYLRGRVREIAPAAMAPRIAAAAPSFTEVAAVIGVM